MSWRIAAWIVAAASSLTVARIHGAETGSAPPSTELIAQWIQQLDDEAFVARQAAQKNLVRAGTAAIEPVAAAATGGSLEVTDRAVRILFELASSDETAANTGAMEALVRLAAAQHKRAANRARTALAAYQLRIVALLERCGATVSMIDDRIVSVRFDEATTLDGSLALLFALPDLEYVSFSTPLFDDRGLAAIAGLPKVHDINLYRSRVSDAGMKHLKSFPSLRRVPMGETLVTDKGLVHLKELKHIEYIGLRANQITDAGLVELKGLTSLRGLHLGETKVTDAGLEHLRELTNLEYVTLWQTAVTEIGAAKLKEALPNLEIRLKETP